MPNEWQWRHTEMLISGNKLCKTSRCRLFILVESSIPAASNKDRQKSLNWLNVPTFVSSKMCWRIICSRSNVGLNIFRVKCRFLELFYFQSVSRGIFRSFEAKIGDESLTSTRTIAQTFRLYEQINLAGLKGLSSLYPTALSWYRNAIKSTSRVRNIYVSQNMIASR